MSTTFFFDLNHSRKLGSRAMGNLTLKEDVIGLYAEATTGDPEIVQLAENRGFTGWSFEFRLNNQTVEAGGANGLDRHLVDDIDLLAVSILSVTPAYIATTVNCRSEEGTEQSRIVRADVSETEGGGQLINTDAVKMKLFLASCGDSLRLKGLPVIEKPLEKSMENAIIRYNENHDDTTGQFTSGE